jgi:hypothetical protein
MRILTPARSQTAVHARLTLRGSIAVPTDVVKMRSGSTHTYAAKRLATWSFRCVRSISTRASGRLSVARDFVFRTELSDGTYHATICV